MHSRHLRSLLLPAIYLAASYQFLRYYVTAPYFYLRLPAYFKGTERLPFQYRILPILFLKPLSKLRLIRRIAFTRRGPLHNPDRICFLLLSIVALAVIFYFTMRLYRALSVTRRLEFLVYPVLLFILIWTYVIHIEQDFSYPYDLPSLAFFTAGIYYIYRRRFLPLVFIVFVGSFNRETTLFLVPIFILDAASTDLGETVATFRNRFNFSQVPWLRVALLTVIWLAIKAALTYAFRWNDRSEDYLRLHENLIRFCKPFYWPAMLDLAGYVLPVVLLFKNRIRPRRFANYLYVLIPWLGVMMVSAVVLETRVYGELSCYVAICAVLIFEQWLESSSSFDQNSRSAPEQKVPQPSLLA